MKEGAQIVDLLNVMEAHVALDEPGERPDTEGNAEQL